MSGIGFVVGGARASSSESEWGSVLAPMQWLCFAYDAWSGDTHDCSLLR